jgi:hypothetical protein
VPSLADQLAATKLKKAKTNSSSAEVKSDVGMGAITTALLSGVKLRSAADRKATPAPLATTVSSSTTKSSTSSSSSTTTTGRLQVTTEQLAGVKLRKMTSTTTPLSISSSSSSLFVNGPSASPTKRQPLAGVHLLSPNRGAVTQAQLNGIKLKRTADQQRSPGGTPLKSSGHVTGAAPVAGDTGAFFIQALHKKFHRSPRYDNGHIAASL